MRLISKDRLKTLVYTQQDLEDLKMGRTVDFRKISQRRLAKRAGVHPSLINHLTSGRRASCSPETAEAISEVFGLDVTMLFEPEMPISNKRTA